MTRLQFGIIRYASVANEIARALGVATAPECNLGQGRSILTFRQLGASRWPERQQLEYALAAAATARSVFATDSRRTVRGRFKRASVGACEDASSVNGCSVTSRWECVIPASARWIAAASP
jgi:hypothetical protein